MVLEGIKSHRELRTSEETFQSQKIPRLFHQISASRISKEIQKDWKEVFEVDFRALPTIP